MELAPSGRDELLIRIKAAGLCHSDLSVINGNRPRPTPMALGHEAAGIVEQVGEGTQGFEPVDALMSERLKLEEINEAFDRLADGTAVRQLVMF